MSAAAATLDPVAEKFLATTTMKSILGIDQHALDQIMATAYVLYQAGRYDHVNVLCRGLIAADHTYWWSYSLHAAALRRLGRFAEALTQLDLGLVYEPGTPKLLEMRAELVAAIASEEARAASGAAMSPLGAVPSTVTTTKLGAIAVGR